MQELITFLKTLFLAISVIFSSMFGLNSSTPEPRPEDPSDDIVIEEETTEESTTEETTEDETTTEKTDDETTTEPDSVPLVFTYLEYPEEAVKTLANNGITVDTLTARANKNNANVDAACKGYSDVNGIVISPYYTAQIDDAEIPVYAASVYSEETDGALHSFSEIYIKEDMTEVSFALSVDSADLTITDAVYIVDNTKSTATVANGKMIVNLSGYGIYTFLFNSESQAYAYTLFVREYVDDDAKIAELESQGYTVLAYDGYIDYKTDFNAYYTNITSWNNIVVYLRQGTYVCASNYDDGTTNAATFSEGSDCAGIGGLTRYPLIGGSGVNNVKIMGYGTIDFTDLDRLERKGLVFSWGSNIEISGIKLINSGDWAIQTYRINGLTISDVDVFGYRTNSDAFDICNSQNVTVDNCFARSGDDLFAVKTLGGEDATSCYSTDIEITNCVAWAGKARAFGISGEANLPISDVTFKDCTVICHDATWGEYEIAAIGIMVSECTKSGNTISNITFENISIFRNDSAAFSLYVLEGVSGSAAISNIIFKNVKYASNTVLSKVFSPNAGTSFNTIIFEDVYCGDTDLYTVKDSYNQYIETSSNVSNFDFR